ncbi:MAG: protein kinase [Gammaproteobacteria bacterium]|nr:protein kinase [Gammaproteobacteria bacterium]MDH3408617.1 protein kinase [Gammaproteobacteria bacterium]MDH3553447.1 protein kinase [Gammaproteobacteria bacterium]
MKPQQKQKRNRLIALSFVSVLLILVYGPLAQWFVAADRMLYDRLATHLPNKPLDNAVIVSIDPSRISQGSLVDTYGRVIAALNQARVKRIIMAQPPEMADNENLPGWAVAVNANVPVYAPTRHRFADLATRNGFVEVRSDSDGVLRRSELWQLNDGVMSPSLPLAIAFDNHDATTSHRVSSEEDAIYLSNYEELDRVKVDDLLDEYKNKSSLAGATVFLDSAPALVGAAAILPSGQFVTVSEITAALLADVEKDRTIIAPSWVGAMEWLAPILLAIVAVLFMPDRSRKDIAVLAGVAVVMLLLLETLLLYVLHVRIDLGRPIVIFAGVAILSIWLTGDAKQELKDAFKKGNDYLAAGRLEPAFAEFRRCPPSETVATVMYKLSLAFEEQAKPERAEAVLEWMKRTQGTPVATMTGSLDPSKGPQRLGRYVIERRIGRGAMGAVYLAKDPRINRPVALKAIPIEKEFEDEELKEARLRFYREAESAGRLAHPNIITVFDAGEDKGLAYIAMEYVPGTPLKAFTDPTKLLAPKRALELCASTADALDYAHNQGVIHRDIKPANLMYNPKEGSLKITDFGVARMTDNNSTKTGIVLGTPMYMSPEQLAAEDLTGLSDLFSLGVTLYELLAGEVPFKATNIAILMTKITSEDPAPISQRRAGIPPSVDAVLAKALAKRPEDRFSCGAEMAIALRNCARYS